MPSYHSQFTDKSLPQVCGMAIVPIKTKLKGPAPNATGTEDDVVDEAIQLFRANVLFASFEVQSPADRVLIFLTLFITQILQRMQKAGNKSSAQKLLFELAKENFPIPGEQGWPLGGHILSAKGRDDEEKVRNYMKQLREECCTRMLEIFYKESQEVPNKHWMAYSKRKYMNILVR